jgi:WD40 repeat protein
MIEDSTKIYRLSKIVDIPSGIDSMCISPEKKFIAVGRLDGSIEVWTSDTWIQLIKVPGIQGKKELILDCDLRKIFFKKIKKEENTDNLNNLRLFSTGLNGYVIEWCLIENKPKLIYENPGESAIWDCDLINNKFLLIACEDGSPRSLQIKKNIILLNKQFSKQNTKILSIKSNPFDNHSSFFTGHNDGTIKKWNYLNGQIELVINLTSSKIKNDSSLLIWSLFIPK